MAKSIVDVKIFGHEYKISGDKSEEYIRKVADHVDENMREIAQMTGWTAEQALAVLSAVNIADEYFETAARLNAQEEVNARNEADIDRYVKLWEDTKRNFTQLKDKNSRMEQEIASLKKRLEAAEKEANEGAKAKLEEAEARVREAENNFFDLQMENIRIKNELERYKRTQNDF